MGLYVYPDLNTQAFDVTVKSLKTHIQSLAPGKRARNEHRLSVKMLLSLFSPVLNPS